MKTLPFTQIIEEHWDAVVDSSSQAWLFHRRDWIDIEAGYWAKQNLSFAVVDSGGRVVGVCPLYLRSHGRGKWIERVLDSGHHRHTGPAFAAGLPPDRLKAGQSAAMRHILSEAIRLDVDRILLNASNRAPAALTDRRAEIPFWATDYGFHLGVGYGPQGDAPAPGCASLAADQIVDLSLPEDQIFRRLDESYRRAVRKSVKEGLTVKAVDSGQVRVYYELAEKSAARTGESLQTIEYYQRVWNAFASVGKAKLIFASSGDRLCGAVFLLCDKLSVNYFGGVSDPDFLQARVNNFLHWEAIRWAKTAGFSYYGLGPIFPELPPDWPIFRVSRFKGTLGGDSYRVIEGSLFMKPSRYKPIAVQTLDALSEEPPACLAKIAASEFDWQGLDIVLRRYGFLGLPLRRGQFVVDPHGSLRESLSSAGAMQIVLVSPKYGMNIPGVQFTREGPRSLLYDSGKRGFFFRGRPAYHALLPHVSFSGPGLEPIWINRAGRAVIAWHTSGEGRKRLLVGIDIVGEIVRHTQGDPEALPPEPEGTPTGQRVLRARYLYENQIFQKFRTIPWADRLGFQVAELFARATGLPLIEPFPAGAQHVLMITGDDDQAFLEAYAQQLNILEDAPIKYFMLPSTNHTAETLAAMPSNVEFGLHVDALDEPHRYADICREQLGAVERLCGRKLRTIRNHAVLHGSDWSHVSVWERNGLILDVNLSGLDGAALCGTFIPFRHRKSDGSWSSHFSLLTAFGDGMLNMPFSFPRRAAKKILRLARQMERDRPGIIAVNFHPQNIAKSRRLHEVALSLHRSGRWLAVGAESYLDWLLRLEKVKLREVDGKVHIHSESEINQLAVRQPDYDGWTRQILPRFQGTILPPAGLPIAAS